MTRYIVVSENEIVKAEMERPEQKNYNFGHGHNEAYRYNKDLGLWHDHIASLPRIVIQGKHNWKVWQGVPESEIRWQYQYCKQDNIYRWFNCEKIDHIGWPKHLRRIVAIPIQPTPEGEKVDCSQRKKELFGQSDMKVVAEDIGDLHYETLANLLVHLSQKISSDGVKDYKAGRNKLSLCLNKAEMKILESALIIKDAWLISKPFMTNDNTQTK